MAPAFDTTGTFNQAAFSDVTLKFGDRELKCHKVILSNNSEYFKAMLSPQRNFAESSASIIELHGDDPSAVEAMLRYIYGFEYGDIVRQSAASQLPEFHISVRIVAKKYMLPNLAKEAVMALGKEVKWVELGCVGTQNATKLSRLINLLFTNWAHDEEFEKMMLGLSEKHLTILMTKAAFRSLLEQKGGEKLSELVVKTIKGGQAINSSPKVFKCDGCGLIWTEKVSRRCISCMNVYTGHAVFHMVPAETIAIK